MFFFFNFGLCTEIPFLWRWRLSGLGVDRNSCNAIGDNINKAQVTYATGCKEYFEWRNSREFVSIQLKMANVKQKVFKLQKLFRSLSFAIASSFRKRNSNNHLWQTKMIWVRRNRPYLAYALFWSMQHDIRRTMQHCRPNYSNSVYQKNIQRQCVVYSVKIVNELISIYSKIVSQVRFRSTVDEFDALKIIIWFSILISFSVNELLNESYEIPTDAIDCANVTFNLKNELVDGVPKKTTHKINIGKIEIKMLLNELKTVRNLMSELE